MILCYNWDNRSEKPIATEISVVDEFVYFFLEEIPGLPPKRDIDFSVELKPGTRPISKAPYRMAPKEMEDLKKQLDDTRFVKDLCNIDRPMTNLMRKENRFHWDESCEIAFQTLKKCLTTTPVLALPEGSENFELKDEVTKMGIHMIRKGDAIGDLTVEPEFYDSLRQKELLDPKIQEWRGRIGNNNMLRFFIHADGSERYDGRWCVPDNAKMRKAIMTEAHCTSFSVHLGGDKLYKDLKKTFWWPGMKQDIAEFVARYTWRNLQLDNGYRKNVVRLHEIPKGIESDREARFISRFWQELQELMGTTLKMSTTFHPATDR
ncbi:uncharacterized protein LOC141607539 [Silene latifolia]|uniref:uncharacterized protein LOC141607539 n=1 Tax=Silene latifolia TaxID=37657 RepID=UPI003D779D7E